MKTHKWIVGIIFSILISISSAAFATTYYIDPDGNDSNSGTSWATAFKTINKGIDTSANGDTIEVNEGTYYENIDFNGKAITLRSTDPNNWTIVEETIIDGSNSTSVVKFGNSEGQTSVISGFTIQHGYGGGEDYYAGGGIFCSGSNPEIRNCVIKDNDADCDGGGGIACFGGAPKIHNCIITHNITYCDGSGIMIANSKPQITNCIITRNSSGYYNGGGIYCSGADANIINCTIANNSTSVGGGIYISSSNPKITNCILWSNTGGEISKYSSSPTVTYCCVQGGYTGTGNISSDPCFVNAGINDFHLSSNSPCINAGDPNTTGLGEMDIDNTARYQGGRFDMGADEKIYNVHNVTQNKWYMAVQAAIDEAASNNEIIVYPGTYHEGVNFNGKAITLTSTDPNNWNVVENTIIDGNNSISYPVLFSNSENANTVLKGFTIQRGSYGIYCYVNTSPTIKRCIIKNHSDRGIYCGGSLCHPTITNNIISDNNNYGICSITAIPSIKNNLIYNQKYGIYFNSSGAIVIRNNTIVNNTVNGIKKLSGTGGSYSISNCIVWNNNDDLLNCTATYSCIQDGDSGTGNISSDPCFVNAGINDFHLSSNSPCINAGDPNTTGLGEMDIDNTARYQGGRFDMGADEIIYSVHNVTQNKWYMAVQAAIDEAASNNELVVYPGTYYENINFKGKAITLRSTDPNNWAIVETTIIDANSSGIAVTVDANAVLRGFTIKGSNTYGIYCNSATPTIERCIIKNNSTGVYASSSGAVLKNNKIFSNTNSGINYINSSTPDIKNNLIYSNNAGITCGNGSSSSAAITNNTIVKNTNYGIQVISGGLAPTIKNCIIWDNSDDLADCNATYSSIQDGDSDTGNISSYPYFYNFNANDFHLTWNSPCINRGDANGTYSNQTDIDDENRVANEKYVNCRVDIGADEFNLHNINLIKNPDFEDGTDAQGTPLHWLKAQVYSASIDTSETHSGSHSWKFIGNVNNWNLGFTEPIPVTFGHSYKLNCWTKCQSRINRSDVYWFELDANGTVLSNYGWEIQSPGLVPWTPYGGLRAIRNKNTKNLNVTFYSPAVCSGTAWWDDFSLVEEIDYLPPYGIENKPNVAETVNFGGTEINTDWINGYSGFYASTGYHWNDINGAMGTPQTDSNDENISYRTTIGDRTMVIEFPAFNVAPNDANGLPLTPMLLEIMYKDTFANDGANIGSGFSIRSKIGHINPDPNYGITDPNDRDYFIAHLGDCKDGKWKYIQYAFQKSDFQLLRAIDGKFTIKIYSPGGSGGISINYISLRAISQADYEALTRKQKEMRGFYEIEMPANNPSNPSYTDSNLVVFVRDIMKPVYQHTKPDINEPNKISTFSAWGEVEPVSFSIYSKNGISNLSITTSNLTNGNSVITNSNITAYHVIYDEKRLVDFLSIYSYALLPDRIEEFNSLSVEPNTSESIWLKIHIPHKDPNLAAGLYKGQVTIKRNGEPDVHVPIDVNIYNFTLDSPKCSYPVVINEYLSSNKEVMYGAVAETGFDPFISCEGLISRIGISEYPNNSHNVVFDTNDFEKSFIRAIAKGFVKNTVMLWLDEWYAVYPIYQIVTHSTLSIFDVNLYDHLSDPDFATPFGKLVEEYIKMGRKYNVKFIFFLVDEPSSNACWRIIADRLANIIKDSNYVHPDINEPNYVPETAVTYYTNCDENCPHGIYDINTPDGNIPPLTNLVDYKIWTLSGDHQGIGYKRHQDPNYHGHLGYYTTHYSQIRNPVYNRFLHGLFAFATDAKIVFDYKFGFGTNDTYNDFDSDPMADLPSVSPDFMYAYPTWSGKLLPTIGGIEGIREGIKDAKYIATLKNILATADWNDSNVTDANNYLAQLKSAIDPNHYSHYVGSADELGYYKSILKDISVPHDSNDYEVFTQIRKTIADYIILLKRQ